MYNSRETTIQLDPSSCEASYLTNLFDGLTIELTAEGNPGEIMEVQGVTEQACREIRAARKRKYEECAARVELEPKKRQRRRIDAGLSVPKFMIVLGGWTRT